MAAAASLWASRFPGRTSVPLGEVAAAVAAASGANVDDTATVLLFTAATWEKSAYAAPPFTPRPTAITPAEFAGWMARFGEDGETPALTKAMALFARPSAGGPLVLQPWYFGGCVPSAVEAQTILAGKPAGTFFVRSSASQANAFAVSYVIGADVRHTRIVHVKGGYSSDSDATVVPTLKDVVCKFATVLVNPVESPLSRACRYLATPAAAPSPPSVGVMPPVTAQVFDIMLSYNWSSQPTVKRIRDALAADGYAVWMDLDNMGAGYAQAMVGAVSRSRCVVICCNTKYIASSNCTVEAGLCFEHKARSKKPILIANMEEGFYPGTVEHVLATLAAGQLYCDFTRADKDEENFVSGLAMLRKQLQEAGVPRSNVPTGMPAPVTPVSPAPVAGSGAGTMPVASSPVLLAQPSFSSSDLAAAVAAVGGGGSAPGPSTMPATYAASFISAGPPITASPYGSLPPAGDASGVSGITTAVAGLGLGGGPTDAVGGYGAMPAGATGYDAMPTGTGSAAGGAYGGFHG